MGYAVRVAINRLFLKETCCPLLANNLKAPENNDTLLQEHCFNMFLVACTHASKMFLNKPRNFSEIKYALTTSVACANPGETGHVSRNLVVFFAWVRVPSMHQNSEAFQMSQFYCLYLKKGEVLRQSSNFTVI